MPYSIMPDSIIPHSTIPDSTIPDAKKMMMRTFKRTILLGALAAANAFAADAPSIEIQKFAFAPKEITIAPGTKVVWINHDETPHAISASDKAYVSKAMDTDDRYEHVFASEGDFSYFCTLHPFMTGTIHVRK
jgi:plastocyanin